MQKIVLFDIDRTLFDTEIYLEKLYNNLSTELGYDLSEFYVIAKQVSDKTRLAAGHFNPDIFLKNLLDISKKPTTLKNLQNIFCDKNIYKESLYPDVKQTFSLLKDNGIVIGIFSTGDSVHQNQKIEALIDVLEKNHIHIAPDKLKIMKDTLYIYKKYKICLVDDWSVILSEVKKHNKHVFTIWIKRNKNYKGALIPDLFAPDAEVENLSTLIKIINTNN